MEQVIRRIVLRLFPELTSGLHLPRFGRIIDLPELPTEDGERHSDAFYPRYAADVQLLDENGNATKAGVLQAVPLPLPGAGPSAGRLEPPAIGALVEIAFAYGRPDKPFIRAVLGLGFDLPAIGQGESRYQQREGVFQHIDADGNFVSKTDKDSTLECLNQRIKVLEDQLTEVQGQMALTIAKDLRISANNITEDADSIKLNGGKGVVTCAHICHFTGAPHGDGSATVTAGK